MKKCYAIFIIFILNIPTFLCSTAVRFVKFTSSNKTSEINLIGDMHVPSNLETKQREGLLHRLSGQNNVRLLVEDICALEGVDKNHVPFGFLPSLVEEAQKNTIDAVGIEFRYGPCDSSKYPDRVSVLLKAMDNISGSVPLLLQTDFKNMNQKIVEMNVRAKEIVQKSACSLEETMLFLDILEPLEMRIFDMVSLCSALNKASSIKNIYLCMGDDHVVSVCSYLKQLGYNEDFHKVSYDSNDALMESAYNSGNIDAFALDLTSCLSAN